MIKREDVNRLLALIAGISNTVSGSRAESPEGRSYADGAHNALEVAYDAIEEWADECLEEENHG